MASRRFYVGLAATMHDPALAVVAADGTPLFAEGGERALQCKRAFNTPPDDPIRVPRLLERICGRDAEVVLAVSWSDAYLRKLDAMLATIAWAPDALTRPASRVAWPLPHALALSIELRSSIAQAGLMIASSPRLANPVSLRRYDHHLTHAANAAWTSPFDECAVAVVDGYGEDASTGWFELRRGGLARIEAPAPAAEAGESLGMFYARLCAMCGFDPLEGEEWKVMGLAAYGRFSPECYELLRPLIAVEDLSLASGCPPEARDGVFMRIEALLERIGPSPADRADVAFTGQRVFEETLIELFSNLRRRQRSLNLAFAGGCALNSSCNGRIVERTGFARLHVPSAPADDGNALGAALLACAEDRGGLACAQSRGTPYLGSEISVETLERLVAFGGLPRLRHLRGAIAERAARLLADGAIVGWVQGKAEFGPRALGHRSILADPRAADIKDRINERVKFRETFRPFAPAILDEFGDAYFERYQPSRFMERTLAFREEAKKRVPGVVHADGTGRVQSVREEWDPLFHALLTRFHALSGVPVLLNTSLNIMGRPIAHSLEDCLGLFFTTGLDALAVGDYLLEK
jgi:carbamoyltransferase